MLSITQRRQLIARLEHEARLDPRKYRLHLALLAALGFAVLGGAATVALALSVGLVAVLWAYKPILILHLAKLLWIPIGLSWLMLKALWVRFEMPVGHRLRRDEAPALWDEVERLRRAADAPRIDGIVIDADLNAAAVTVPRLMGLLGHKRVLLLGLPLMQRLDADEFAAVVAHEFGHFGGKHGHFGGWIYYVRLTWDRVLWGLSAQRSFTTALFVRFFEWYAPYFNAYSYVLARRHEHEADETAARVAGPQAMGRALASIDTGAELLAKSFYPALQRSMQTSPTPTKALLAEIGDFLRAPREDDARLLERALARQPDEADTHPPLGQRLAALGVAPSVPAPPARSAADALLGEWRAAIEASLSQAWHDESLEGWQADHALQASNRTRLAELEAIESRNAAESLEHARIVEALHGEDAALPLFQAAAHRFPDEAPLHGRLGVLLLQRDDAAGIEHLRKAMALDADAREQGLALIDDFHRRSGADDALRDAVAREARDARRSSAVLEGERFELTFRDRLAPHGLDEAQLQRVRDILAREKTVSRAWLVRKTLSQPTATPHYVLLVRRRMFTFTDGMEELVRIRDADPVPGTFLVTTESHQRWAARRVRKASGGPVYHRR